MLGLISEQTSTTEPKFKRGDPVQKVSGYMYPGIVLVAYQTLKGKWRYVVETLPGSDYEEMQHIFNGDQLEKRND